MSVARVVGSLSEIPASKWDALHDGRNPFIAHAFLSGLETHGALLERNGWTARHLLLHDDRGTLVAAAPGYIKRNSHGEFVFDHAWAHAYARYGEAYFPKWLCAVPYTPVTGPRLLARDPDARAQLVQAIETLTAGAGLSSAHVNFIEPTDDDAFGANWLSRVDLQYHWRNFGGWGDFDAFLAAMDHKHRKNIRQERAKLARAGVQFRIVHGDEASDSDLSAMHGFYLQTFAEYGNTPTLTLAFFRHLAREAVEVGLADGFFGRHAHAVRHQLVAGGEAALGVLAVNERGDQVDHRAQDVALVRQRIGQVAALGAGIRTGGFGRFGGDFRKAAHEPRNGENP